MSSTYYTNPLVFLIDTFFSLYILVVMLRFILQWVNAEFHNPISQFLVKITHPPIRLLRRFIPSIGRIDTASFTLMLALQVLAGSLIFGLQGLSLGVGALLVWSCSELLSLFLNVFLFAIILRALISWVSPGTYNHTISILYSITEPALTTIRRIVPPISGIDLSPLIALIGLQIIKMLILPPLIQITAMLG